METSSAHRSYGGIDNIDEGKVLLAKKGKADTLKNLAMVRFNIIGNFRTFNGPFGPRPCIYADWTASGRGLRQVEKFMVDEVLPFYGNTHTTTSITGHQSTCFRHESRQIIAEAVNAKVPS